MNNTLIQLHLVKRARRLVLVSIAFFFTMLFCVSKGTAADAEVHNSLLLSDFKQPQLATSPNGEIYLTAVAESSIYFFRSSDGGNTFGKKIKVCDLTGPVGRRRGPRIAVSGKSIVITFDSSDVYAVRSTDSGNTWSTPVRINTRKNCAQEGLHGSDGSADGSVFVVWLDTLDGQTEIWGSLSLDAGKTWQPEKKIYASPDGHVCECCHPSVAFGTDGSVSVMWRNWLNGNRDMYVSSSKPVGSPFGPARKIGKTSWKLDGCPMDGGAIITNNGKLTSVWQSKGAVALAQDSVENELGKGTQPVLAYSGTNPVVMYESEGNLMLNNDGTTIVVEKGGTFPVMRSVPRSDRICAAWELNVHEERYVKVATITLGLAKPITSR